MSSFLQDFIRLGTLVDVEKKEDFEDQEVEKLHDLGKKNGSHEVVGIADIEQILYSYLMEVDARINRMLRIGSATGKLSEYTSDEFGKKLMNPASLLKRLHRGLLDVLRGEKPNVTIYSMDEVTDAFRKLFRENSIDTTFSLPDDLGRESMGTSRPSVGRDSVGSHASQGSMSEASSNIKGLTDLNISDNGRSRARTWASSSEKCNGKVLTGTFGTPRARSGYEDLVLVKPNLALYDGRKKVSSALKTLENVSRNSVDEKHRNMIKRAIKDLKSAMNDLMDELSASSRGEWDNTTIERQRHKLTHDEKDALDFVLATTTGMPHSRRSSFTDEDPDRKWIPRRRGSVSTRPSHKIDIRSRSKDPRRGRRNSHHRKSGTRSASPASVFLDRISMGSFDNMPLRTSVNDFSISLTPTPEVNKWLRKADSWDEFDVWQFSRASNGYPLSRLFLHYMDGSDLFQRCGINRNLFVNYVRKLEEGYLDVPYHNNIHATDVLHATHFMLQSKVLSKICRKYPLLQFGAYFAAAAHDFKHPGTNNEYAQNMQLDIAIRYNDISILENMHVAEAFHLIKNGPNCNFLRGLERGNQQLLRRFVISMVLHTDMAKHNDLVVKLRRNITSKKETGSQWLDQKDAKAQLNETEFLLDMMLHCADLANACRPRHIMEEWCKRVISEFWKQGDLERIHGIPVGPGRDRATANVPLGQQFFIKVLVSPLYTLWKEVVPETEVAVKLLHENLAFWTAEVEREKKKKETEASNKIAQGSGSFVAQPQKRNKGCADSHQHSAAAKPGKQPRRREFVVASYDSGTI